MSLSRPPLSSRQPSFVDTLPVVTEGGGIIESAALVDGDEEDIQENAETTTRQDGQDADERTALLPGRKSRKAAWKLNPSPWFIVAHLTVFAFGMGMLIPSRLELFTQIICAQRNRDAVNHIAGGVGGVLLLTPEQCRRNSGVQRRLSQLNLMLQLVMGICCVFATPYWGALSDRVGRKWCIVANMLSFVLGTGVMLVVLSNPHNLSYYWLLLYPLFEGIFAGMGGGQSIMAAYIGDCTPAGSRAALFSLMTGLLYGGMSAGPALGSFIISASGNNMMAFYVAFGLYCVQALVLMIVLPESLSRQRQTEAREAYEAKMADKTYSTTSANSIAGKRNVYLLLYPILAVGRPVLRVLAPIGLLGPRKAANGNLDWSLPGIAVASGLYTMVMTLYPIKMQYAQLKFGWTPVQLGNLLSLLGVARITALLVIIPVLIKLIRKPHQQPVREEPTAEPEPEAGQSATSSRVTDREVGASGFTKAEDEQWSSHTKQHRLLHDYKFDLLMARISLCLDVVCYTGLVFTQTSNYFLILSVTQSLASGANPALSSLALMFAGPQESGKLMAAIAMVSTLMGQIIAPVLFNGLFAATVDTFPEAFFVAGAVCFFLTLLCLIMVRLRRPKWSGYEPAHQETSGASTSVA